MQLLAARSRDMKRQETESDVERERRLSKSKSRRRKQYLIDNAWPIAGLIIVLAMAVVAIFFM
jgi:hypothetical protein